MSQPIRWGVLGTGAIAKKLAKAIRGTETAAFEGIASRASKPAEASTQLDFAGA